MDEEVVRELSVGCSVELDERGKALVEAWEGYVKTARVMMETGANAIMSAEQDLWAGLREVHPELDEFHLKVGKDCESLLIISRKEWYDRGHPN